MFGSNLSVRENPSNSSSNTPRETGQSQFEMILLTVCRYLTICVVILILLIILICCRPIFKFKINHYKPLKPDKMDSQIILKHLHCSIEVTINYWPDGYQSIQFYQICNLHHRSYYGNCHKKCKSNGERTCKCKYRREYLFNIPNIEKDSPDHYVLDSLDTDKLFYTEIRKEEFTKSRKILEFSDRPSGMWGDIYMNHPLVKIVKKQYFKLFLVGKKDNNELHTFQSWQWGYEMLYLNGKQNYKLKYLTFTHEALPQHLIKLPNANSCVGVQTDPENEINNQ